jgi:hypothetical protein
MINPDTFTIDVSLEIACSDDDQILSRPVGEGYTWEQLVQSHVRFSGYDGDVGAVPIDAGDAGGELTVTGYCESAEFSLSATTFDGKTISLGKYGSESQAEAAKVAIAAASQLNVKLSAELEALKVSYDQRISGMRLDVITQVDAHGVTREELAALKSQHAHKGCKAKLAAGQWWSFCGETDMGQTAPALCTKCGGTYRPA